MKGCTCFAKDVMKEPLLSLEAELNKIINAADTYLKGKPSIVSAMTREQMVKHDDCYDADAFLTDEDLTRQKANLMDIVRATSIHLRDHLNGINSTTKKSEILSTWHQRLNSCYLINQKLSDKKSQGYGNFQTQFDSSIKPELGIIQGKARYTLETLPDGLATMSAITLWKTQFMDQVDAAASSRCSIA